MLRTSSPLQNSSLNMFAYTVLGTHLECLTSQGHPCQPLTPSTRHPHLRCSLCSLFAHRVYPLRRVSRPPLDPRVGSIAFFTAFSHLRHPPTASSSPTHIPFGALPGCPDSQDHLCKPRRRCPCWPSVQDTNVYGGYLLPFRVYMVRP